MLCVVTLLLLSSSATHLYAQLGSDYTFETNSDAYVSITGGTEVISGTTTSTFGTFDESRTAGSFNIGFDFVMNCVTYTQFNVASSGLMTLGTTAYGSTANNLTTSGAYPIIAPFWDHQHMYDGNCSPPIDPDIGVYYRVTGTAPNRVLTVEWRTQFNSGGTYYWYNCSNGPLLRYQARLYEGSNRIEFQYGPMFQALDLSASIGIAAANNDYISVTPGATSTTVSSTTANNSVNIASTGIPEGTIYEFTPNKLSVDGRTGPGDEGVADLTPGDSLLSNVLDFIGQSNVYTPIDLTKPCAASSIPVQLSITGTDASSYEFVATGSQTYSPTISTNTATVPQIQFSPLKGGVHRATLSITNTLNSVTTTYKLEAEADPRILWIGNISEGGTAGVADGDSLFEGFQVIFGNSATWSPITLENTLGFGVAPPANITYNLIDPTGSYAIDMTSDAIDGGEQSTPQITFNATVGVGYQEATLEVTADGETRSFLLRAFAAAPGGELYIDDVLLDSTSQLFIDRYACVGEGIFSYEIKAVNTGTGDFIIDGIKTFGTDTLIAQGRPPYQLLRDGYGQPIPLQDYYLSTIPGAAPRQDGDAFPGLIVPEGETRTLWLNMVPTSPTKRYGQIFIQTNGFNLNNSSVDGIPTRGLIRASVFGRGQGALLTQGLDAGRPTGVAIERTEVRESRRVVAWLFNDGDCDLRINRDDFKFESGDVDEFALIEVLPNTPISGNDYLLAPGFGDSVVMEFQPQTYGSRRATIRLATNDSTLGGNGVIERGVYYWDAYGVGNIGLEARNLTLSPAVIGGESSRGFVLLENTSATPIEIENIVINGGGGDIVEDGTNPWPTLPVVLQPGEQLRLWIELDPDLLGIDGIREAIVEVTIKGGDAALAKVSGYAGTRTLAAAPGTLFTNTQVSVGDLARAFVALTNTGTLPARLDNPTITGANMGDYQISPLRRRALEPGQTEIFEVTYIPQAVGVSTAQLEFGSNATNGTQIIMLGGEATSGTIKIDDPSELSQNQAIPDAELQRASTINDARLWTPVPNPAHESVVLRYNVSSELPVSLEIFNEEGRRVLTVVNQRSEAGEFSEMVDVSSLPSGRFLVRFTVGEKVITEVLNLVR